MKLLLELFFNSSSKILLGFIIAFILSLKINPIIILLGYKKKLVNKTYEEGFPKLKTPTLGGIGIFIAFTLSMILMALIIDLNETELSELVLILGLIITLLFVGIKNDLTKESTKNKIKVHIIIAIITVMLLDLRIYSFHGLFGLTELNSFFSLLFSFIAIVSIIKAYELISDSNGLAAYIAIIANLVLAFSFFISKDYFHTLISSILLGALIGFLKFNISLTRKKLYMGNSGSLVIACLLAFQLINFLELKMTVGILFDLKPNKLVMSFAIISYPIINSLRILLIRILNSTNQFGLLKNENFTTILMLNKKKLTFLAVIFQIATIFLGLFIGTLNIYLQFTLIIILATTPYTILLLIGRNQNFREKINTTEKLTVRKGVRPVDLTSLPLTRNKTTGVELEIENSINNPISNENKSETSSKSFDLPTKKKLANRRVLKLRNILKIYSQNEYSKKDTSNDL